MATMIDILIIGAGPSGLCAAKTFLQYDKDANIVLVEPHATVGGVWSKEQLYPTLKTNNLLGTLDFIDFPMDARFGIAPGEHVTGEAMHAYYSAYAEHFDISRRVRLRTRVVDVRRRETGGGWAVRVVPAGKSGAESEPTTLECAKLVVATGVLSVPHMPTLEGVDTFGAPYIHAVDMGPRADELVHDPDIKTVAVLGGSKSAYDAVYLAATTGHKVEWLIRKSGRGPAWVFPTHTFLGPFKAWREKLVMRRFVSFMSPCVFPDFSGFGWLRRFLHFSSVGKVIAQKFWGAIHADTLRDCGYRVDPKLNILEPEQNPFW
jgi:cation diffusion facilitator CzcD-associated flavoprotein CzcO